MSWLTAGLVTGILSAIGGGMAWLWKIAEQRGYERAKQEFLTAQLERARHANTVQAAPDKSWADFVDSLSPDSGS